MKWSHLIKFRHLSSFSFHISLSFRGYTVRIDRSCADYYWIFVHHCILCIWLNHILKQPILYKANFDFPGTANVSCTGWTYFQRRNTNIFSTKSVVLIIEFHFQLFNLQFFAPFTDVFFLEMHFWSSLRLDLNLSAFWASNLHSWGLNSFIGLLSLQSKLPLTQVWCTLPFTPETKNTGLYFSCRQIQD